MSCNFFNSNRFRCTATALVVAASSITAGLISSNITAAPSTPENSAWNVNVMPEGTDPSAYAGEWLNHTYYPSPEDWRKVAVYQVMSDRFTDGNPENNELAYGGYDLKEVHARHGGDFKGLTDRLDYIKSLGYDAVYISPIFQNRSNSYHGYSMVDFTLLDQRFGTLEELRELTTEAHARGMYVIIDVVVNHMSNLYYFDGHASDAAPFALHDDEYELILRDENEVYTDFAADHTWDPSCTYPDVYNHLGELTVDTGTGSYCFSDFHHNGDLQNFADGFQINMGKIWGIMDDLRTGSQHVQDKMIAMTNALISSADIDGLRVDTPMQVPHSFFQAWIPAVRSHAASLGKDNFFIFGEFYVSRERSATMTGRGKEPSMYGDGNAFIGTQRMFDGGIHYEYYEHNSESTFWTAMKQDNPPASLVGELNNVYSQDLEAYDLFHPNSGEERYKHLLFYNNHDQTRIISSLNGEAKNKLGAAMIVAWPGIPTYYYGDEQGLRTDDSALEGWSREDFMTSLAWSSLDIEGSKNKAIGDNFDMTDEDYLWTQKVMNIFRHYPVLQIGQGIEERYLSSDLGAYVYTRKISDDQSTWALVATNLDSATDSTGEFSTGWDENTVITNVFDTTEEYTVGFGGSLSNLDIEPYEVKIFVPQSEITALNPVVTAVSPSHDERVSGDSEMRITFDQAMDEDSVISAFRVNGASVSPANVQYDELTNTLSYWATVADGITTFSVLDSATTTSGKAMHGSFHSRIRKGSDDNIIANPAAIFDDSLVSVVSGDSVTLNHKATGAEKFRISNDFGQTWSAWFDYASSSSWVADLSSDEPYVTVQYWADGSAAYYVHGAVSHAGYDRTIPSAYVRGSNNFFSLTSPMTLVDDNQWQVLVTFSAGDDNRFLIDIFGDWSRHYGDRNLDGVIDRGGLEDGAVVDIEVDGGSYIVTLNDLTHEYTVTAVAATYPTMYIRGTNNGWSTDTPMTFLGDNMWQANTEFGATGNEIFKFDVYGDWFVNFGDNEGDGIADEGSPTDIQVTEGAGEYRIQFNDATKAYTIEKIGQISEVNLAGTFNGWDLENPMNVTGDNLWGLAVWVPWYESQSFKFFPPGSDFGDDNLDGIANAGQNNIPFEAGMGWYQVEFNSATLVYSIEKLSNYNSVTLAGTFNGWDLLDTPMASLTDTTWSADIEVPWHTDQIFKIFAYGNQDVDFGDNEADGRAEPSGADIVFKEGLGAYQITFDDSQLFYSVEKLANSNAMFVRGSFNDWNTTAMQSTGLNTWSVDLTITSSASQVFKFDVEGDWSGDVYGDNEQDGNAENGGGDIAFTTTPGVYRISFDSAFLTYSVERVAGITEVNLAGNFNGWDIIANPMTEIEPGVWQSEINAPWYSGQAVKFFTNLGDFGDNESDGMADSAGADITLSHGRGHYLITFDSNTMAYSQEPLQNFSSMHLRGSFNEWATTAMTAVDEQNWTANITVDNTEQRFKIDVVGDWSGDVFGDNEQDGIAEPGAPDIVFNDGIGEYTVTFNDRTLAYEITKVSGITSVNIAGQFNDWDTSATAMDNTGNIWSTDIFVPWYTGQAFKLFTNFGDFGDNELDGVMDAAGTDIAFTAGRGAYRITFNSTSFVYTVEKLANYDAVHFAGSFNSWALNNPMTPISTHEWEINIDANGDEVFKFVGTGSLETVWFGDNEADGVAEPDGADITFAEGAGNYTVRFNDATLAWEAVKAANIEPTVTIDPENATVLSNESITLNAIAEDADGSIADYQWSNGETTSAITLEFTTPGSYPFDVTVTDNNGATATASTVITVENRAPAVVINASATEVSHNQTITLTAEASDSDGTIAGYEWNTGETTQTIVVSFTAPGDFTYSVTAADNNGGEATVDVVLTATNQAPVIEITPADAVINRGEILAANAIVTDPEGDAFVVNWDNGATGTLAAYSFDVAGVFTITAVATDEFGASSSVSTTVTVNELTANYATMHVVGHHNGWSLTESPMTLVEDNVWEAEIEFGEGDEFKFVPVDWNLSFGDRDANGTADSQGGGNIALPNGAGPYIVRFNDDTLEYSAELNLGPLPPVADAGADQQVKVGSVVSLSAAASTDPNNDITSYSWDNGFGSGVDVNQLMSTAGEYTVTLTVTDSTGLEATDTVVIDVIANQAPTANAGNDVTIEVGSTINLDGSASTDVDGNIVSYAWNTGHSGATPSILFDTVGEFNIELTVTDNDGDTGTDIVTVTVVEPQPEANFDTMHLVGTHNGWNLTSSPFSLIADNTWQIQLELETGDRFKFVPVDWSFSFGDRNSDGIADSNGGGNITAPATGPYIITFNDETLEYTLVLDLGPQAPTADAGNDITVKVGSEVTLSATGSSDVDGNIVSFDWDNGFGSGESVSQVMNVVGEFTVTLLVTDNDGLTDSDTVTVNVVANQPPTADAGEDITIVLGAIAHFDASASTDSDGEIVNYQWNNGLSGVTANLQYNTLGEHIVTLTVEDNDGATATDEVVVTVIEDEIEGNFPSMHMAGSFNGWSVTETPMALISDNVWQLALNLNNGDRFKFVPIDWSFSFGDRNSDGVADSSGGGNITTSQGNGKYVVTFNDETLEYTLQFNADPQAPVADAGADQTVKVGSTVTLSGNNSTDADGSIISYSWDQGFGTGSNVSQLMDTVGTVTVTLTVTDNEGLTDTDTITINVVENQAPTAVIDGGSQVVSLGATVTFTATASSDSDGNIVSYLWNGASSGESFTLTFNEPGNQQVSVLVTDNDGATDIAVITVTVEDVPQNVAITFTCYNGHTSWGQNVYVVGNIPELGNWNAANALRLNANSYPTWSKQFSDMPAGTRVEWKCIKKGNGSTQWQSGGNNVVTTGETGSFFTQGSF